MFTWCITCFLHVNSCLLSKSKSESNQEKHRSIFTHQQLQQTERYTPQQEDLQEGVQRSRASLNSVWLGPTEKKIMGVLSLTSRHHFSVSEVFYIKSRISELLVCAGAIYSGVPTTILNVWFLSPSLCKQLTPLQCFLQYIWQPC